MKYLQDYMEQRQTKLFKETGAIFAFSTEQFNEQKVEGKKYVNMGSGMLCPKENVEKLINELDKIYKESIKQDVEENGVEKIIIRELNNHEASYTGTTEDTEDALKDYPISNSLIRKVYSSRYRQTNYAKF